jgi:hypothetical protein
MDQGLEERQAGDIQRRFPAQRAADFLHSRQPTQTEEERAAA